MPATPDVHVLVNVRTDVDPEAPSPLPEWVTKTLAFDGRDVLQARLFISAGSELVIEEARRRISRRVGANVTLGQALELLAAEYLAS